MPETPKTPAASSGGERLGVALFALLAAAFFLPILLIAGVAFVLLRNKVQRREAVIVAVASLIGIGLLAQSVFGGYMTWVGSVMPHSHTSIWSIPVTSVLLLSTLLCSLALIVSSTSIGGRVLKRVTTGKQSALENESILPDAGERAVIGSPVTPPSSVVVRIPGHQGAKSGSQFLLGYGKGHTPIYITTNEIGTHAIVMGTTGSGKTVTLKNIMGGLADVGWDVVVIDLKEDTQPGGLRDYMRDYASAHVLPYQEMALSSVDGRYWFDPVAGLGRDYMRDTILSLMEFDDQHWQAMSKNLLGQAIALLVQVHAIDPVRYPSPTMRDIANLLQDGAALPSRTKPMRAILKSALPGYNDADYASLANPSAIDQQASGTFAAKLQGLYVTEAGQRLLTRHDDQVQLDVTKPGFTYIGLDSNGKADLTKIVSSAVLQRLNVYVAERNTGSGTAAGTGWVSGNVERKPKIVIIDEAGGVDRDIVVNLLERGRSSNIAVVLSTQTPGSWRQGGQDDWGRITNNTNMALIMRQANPDEAEVCADYLGKRQQWAVSQRVVEGDVAASGTAKLDYDYHIHPEQIRDLGQGEAILRSGTTQRVEYVKVLFRNPQD